MKISIIVQWLAVLACPAMMLWCVWSMFRSHKHHATGSPGDNAEGHGQRDLVAEVRTLRARLAQLEAEKRPGLDSGVSPKV